MKEGEIQSGQSMFEILFALAIMALIVMAIVGLATIAIRNSSFSRNKSLAEKYATETVDWLRQERDWGWTLFVAKTEPPGKYCLPDLSWSLGGECDADQYISGTALRREIFLRQNAGNVEAEVSVSWSDSQGLHEIKLNSIFSNWRPSND